MSFVNFAQAHGLVLDYAIADDKWHRVPTVDKPRKRNGAYVWDGIKGAVKNWATMLEFAFFRDETTPIKQQFVRPLFRRTDDRERHERGARIANEMLADAKLITPSKPAQYGGHQDIPGHPYLVRKGFPAQPFLSLDGNLLVPMRLGSTLWNIQSIKADGDKRFMPGRAKGLTFALGSALARYKWLVEGYATALSVKAALDSLHVPAQVVVCFSAGNLKYIAEDYGTHVFADHDASGTGEAAARATGLKWVMSPHLGQDANDLMLAEGVEAVAKLIRSAL